VNKICQSHQKIATIYDKHSEVIHLIGERLIEKLDFIKLSPECVLDLGSGTGQFLKPLKKRFPKAKIIGVDIALSMLKQNRKKQGWFNKFPLCVANNINLPFKDNSVDFIFANMLLPYCLDLSKTFKEMTRVLKPEGLLLFSSCGPDTLKELKLAWQAVDTYEHVNRFVDMHDIADVLLGENFSDPVVDMEMLTVNYTSIKQLLKDLKGSGSINLNSDRFKGLSSLQRLAKLKDNYPKKAQYFPATIEIIYGHAWGSDIKGSHLNDDGNVSIAINRIRRK